MSTPPSRRFTLLALVLPLLVGPGVFLAVALGEGMGVGGGVSALVEQLGERRRNPLISGVLGLVPVLLLLGSMWLGRRLGRDEAWLRAAGRGGLAAIVLVLVWANAQFWPLFLPERSYPGFPHGLELVIAPLFFAPVAMLVGAFAGGMLVGRSRAPGSA